MTLVFLGGRDSAEGIWAVASGVLDELEPPVLVPRGVVGVPRRRPRLYALDLEDVEGRAAAMHGAISEALGEPITRPFWPHVTLVRARKGRRPQRPRVPAGLEAFTPTALTLYRSHPGPDGSRYEVLERRAL